MVAVIPDVSQLRGVVDVSTNPDDAVVGEEYGGPGAGLTWYCDPIDGTSPP